MISTLNELFFQFEIEFNWGGKFLIKN